MAVMEPMLGVEPTQEIVEFCLLGGHENRANARMDVMANGVVLGARLILTLLEDSIEALVPIGKNRLDLGSLLGRQVQLMGEAVDDAFAAGSFVQVMADDCAQAPHQPSEYEYGHHQANCFCAWSLTGHWIPSKPPGEHRPAWQVAIPAR